MLTILIHVGEVWVVFWVRGSTKLLSLRRRKFAVRLTSSSHFRKKEEACRCGGNIFAIDDDLKSSIKLPLQTLAYSGGVTAKVADGPSTPPLVVVAASFFVDGTGEPV